MKSVHLKADILRGEGARVLRLRALILNLSSFISLRRRQDPGDINRGYLMNSHGLFLSTFAALFRPCRWTKNYLILAFGIQLASLSPILEISKEHIKLLGVSQALDLLNSLVQ